MSVGVLHYKPLVPAMLAGVSVGVFHYKLSVHKNSFPNVPEIFEFNAFSHHHFFSSRFSPLLVAVRIVSTCFVPTGLLYITLCYLLFIFIAGGDEKEPFLSLFSRRRAPWRAMDLDPQDIL